MSHRRVRVAWLHPVIAHYRVPILNKVESDVRLEVTHFAGDESSGVSVADASGEVEGRVVRLTNVRIPRRPNVIYAIGWSRVVRGGFDVVLTSEAVHNVVNWLLLLLRPFFDYKLIVVGHIRPSGDAMRLATNLRRSYVRRADGIIAYSEEGARQALAWGVAKKRITVWGNTLDLDRIKKARENIEPDRIALLREKLLGDKRAVAFLGRPTPAKRPEVAIDTILELERRGFPVVLFVIGDSAEVPGLRKRAAGSENVRFVGAEFSEERIAEYLSLSEMVFIPGAVGLSAVHAFAYGRPLLTWKLAPHRPEMEAARHGWNCCLVEECSAAAFADAIVKLLTDKGELARLAEGAGATPLNSADAMAAAIVERVLNVVQ